LEDEAHLEQPKSRRLTVAESGDVASFHEYAAGGG
jgi:hypothetical protein